MIDIHSHVLPGVDDGVKTEDEAVEFARVAAEDGIEVIVATPHCKEGFFVNERDTVLEATRRLRDRFEREKIPIRLEPGAEVHLCPDLVERVQDGRALTLANNGQTLLLELSLTQYPVQLENLVFQLKLAGIHVVFAHPERIRYFQDDMKRYEEVIRLGALGQITTGSVQGLFGSDTRSFTEELLRKDLVHVLATDAHNLRRRCPRLREAADTVAAIVGETRARSMVESVPRALLEGREPTIPPLETQANPRPSLFSRWLRRS